MECMCHETQGRKRPRWKTNVSWGCQRNAAKGGMENHHRHSRHLHPPPEDYKNTTQAMAQPVHFDGRILPQCDRNVTRFAANSLIIRRHKNSSIFIKFCHLTGHHVLDFLCTVTNCFLIMFSKDLDFSKVPGVASFYQKMLLKLFDNCGALFVYLMDKFLSSLEGMITKKLQITK
jgi:hypothetical protein